MTNWYAEQWLAGTMPDWYVAATMAARVAPLVKGTLPEDGSTPDCRPVAVGNCGRRLYTSAAMRKYKTKFRKALWPQQAAVGVKDGQQHVTIGVATTMRQRPDFVVVKVDISNAFNECTRAAMLAAVERHPELRPLLPMYAATLIPASKLMMRGANGEIQTIDSMSEEGGHQGCASTGAAFCLALHPSVQAADATLAAVGGYARFFADDGYLVGPRAVSYTHLTLPTIYSV